MEFILPNRRQFIDYMLYCSHSVSMRACVSHTHTIGGSAVLTFKLYEEWRHNLLDCISETHVRAEREVQNNKNIMGRF